MRGHPRERGEGMKARAIPRPLRGWHETGCVVCGRPLVYSGRTQERECCVCHRVLPSDAVCEAGHFVCDDCHSGGGAALLAFLQDSRERDPVKLFLNACALPGVHMHGPEHHGIVPCVLLTACANCGPGRGLGARQAPARRLLRGAGRLRCGGGRGDLCQHCLRGVPAGGGALGCGPAPGLRLSGAHSRRRRAALLQAYGPPLHRGRSRLCTEGAGRGHARLQTAL